jgi:hypothetical protein
LPVACSASSPSSPMCQARGPRVCGQTTWRHRTYLNLSTVFEVSDVCHGNLALSKLLRKKYSTYFFCDLHTHWCLDLIVRFWELVYYSLWTPK